MGNTPATEVDLFKLFLNDLTFGFNTSICTELWPRVVNVTSSNPHGWMRIVNGSEFYKECVQQILPSYIISRPYVMSWWPQFVWTVVFLLMIVVATIGNAIVIWIVVCHRRMRTITNLFLLNLAVADFLLAFFNASFNYIFMVNSHWPFGTTFCIITNFVAYLTVSTSVFTILAMSIDRFHAIVQPLRPRMSKSRACFVILLVWIFGFALSLPSALYSTTITYRYMDQGKRTICYLVWPDGPSGQSWSDHVYNIIFLVLTYVIPMSSMAFTYTWMGYILWGSKRIGESTIQQNEVIKSKQKVVHMMIAIVVLFGVCWLPYHIYFLYTYYFQEIVKTDYIQHIYLAIYWLAMSNSMYNPIVYYWMNERFRNYFCLALCFCKRNRRLPPAREFSPLFARTATFTLSSRNKSCRVTVPSTSSLKVFGPNPLYGASKRSQTHGCCEV